MALIHQDLGPCEERRPAHRHAQGATAWGRGRHQPRPRLDLGLLSPGCEQLHSCPVVCVTAAEANPGPATQTHLPGYTVLGRPGTRGARCTARPTLSLKCPHHGCGRTTVGHRLAASQRIQSEDGNHPHEGTCGSLECHRRDVLEADLHRLPGGDSTDVDGTMCRAPGFGN